MTFLCIRTEMIFAVFFWVRKHNDPYWVWHYIIIIYFFVLWNKVEPNQEFQGLVCEGANVLPSNFVEDAFHEGYGKFSCTCWCMRTFFLSYRVAQLGGGGWLGLCEWVYQDSMPTAMHILLYVFLPLYIFKHGLVENMYIGDFHCVWILVSSGAGKVVNIRRLDEVISSINGWYMERGLFGLVSASSLIRNNICCFWSFVGHRDGIL